MKWSSSPPDREGWWWIRDSSKHSYIVFVDYLTNDDSDLTIFHDNGDWSSVSDSYYDSSQFAGPLQEPEEDN